MRRFSLASMTSGSTSSPQPTANSSGASTGTSSNHAFGSLGGRQPSMSMANMNIGSMNMSSMNMNLDLSFMKSMGGAIGGNKVNNVEAVKQKSDELEMRVQLNNVIAMLDNVRLQCPAGHSGLVVAYSSATMAPLLSPGLKFTWYRLGNGQQQFYQVDESTRAWYSPTFDDIGCKICAQCEDNFDQGFSRYIECGPIAADPGLCTLAESALEHSYFEAKDVSVSLGLQDRGYDNELASVQESDPSMSGHGNNDNQSSHHVSTSRYHTAHDRATALSMKSDFLQMDGRSAVTVDSQGIFISIPVPLTPENQAISSASTFRASSRGMRIPPSQDMTVYCTQPASLILCVPVRDINAASSNSESTDATDSNNEATSRSRNESGSDSFSNPVSSLSSSDNTMNKFLSSSTLTIPWTYEGIHSPEAIAGSHSSFSNDSQAAAEIKAFAEQDAINFANTISSLALFVSSLPEDTKVLKICIACSDRLQRDLLVSSIRALSCQPPGATTEERMTVFPWRTTAGSNESSIAQSDIGSNLKDLQLRLRNLEEENVTLKRERSELTNQIMSQRELTAVSALQNTSSHARAYMNNIGSSATSGGAVDGLVSTSGSIRRVFNDVLVSTNESASSTQSDTSNQDNDPHSKASRSENNHETVTASGEDISSDQSVSTRIIELENKLKVASRKETEATKLRGELESRNKLIQSESDKHKKAFEDIRIQFTLLKHEKDLLDGKMHQHLVKMEDLQAKFKEAATAQLELEDLKPVLVTREMDLQILKKDNEELKSQLESSINSFQDLELSLNKKCRVLSAQLAALEADKVAKELRIDELEDICGSQKLIIDTMAPFKQRMQEAEESNNKLNGEINHLKKKAESQGRDLQKAIKESTMMLGQYETALMRKSSECTELERQIDDLTKELEEYLGTGEEEGSRRQRATGIKFSLPTVNISNIDLDPLKIIAGTGGGGGSSVGAGFRESSEDLSAMASLSTGPSSLLQSFVLASLRANQSQGTYTADNFSPPPPRTQNSNNELFELLYANQIDESTSIPPSNLNAARDSPVASPPASSTNSGDSSVNTKAGAGSVSRSLGSISDQDLSNKQFSEEILVENIGNLSVLTVIKTQRYLSREFIDNHVMTCGISKDIIRQFQPQYFSSGSKRNLGNSVGDSNLNIDTALVKETNPFDDSSNDDSSSGPKDISDAVGSGNHSTTRTSSIGGSMAAAKTSLKSLSASIDQSGAKTVENMKGLFRRISVSKGQTSDDSPASSSPDAHSPDVASTASANAKTSSRSGSAAIYKTAGLPSPPVMGRYASNS